MAPPRLIGGHRGLPRGSRLKGSLQPTIRAVDSHVTIFADTPSIDAVAHIVAVIGAGPFTAVFPSEALVAHTAPVDTAPALVAVVGAG